MLGIQPTKPILKYVGGKRWLIPYISQGIRSRLASTGGRYIEPFLGGAAIALDLGLPQMILADSCESLIICYRAAIKNPEIVYQELMSLISLGTDESTYYEVRSLKEEDLTPEQSAARFVYMNRLCYNGVIRFNKKGLFNVPYGKQNPSFPSYKQICDFSLALSGSSVFHQDFRETLKEATKGDVVFADPPYAATFSGYTKDGFSQEDQEDLAICLCEASERGAFILSTNSDCEEIRGFYEEWCEVVATKETRAISQDISNRGKSSCLLVTNDLSVLGISPSMSVN